MTGDSELAKSFFIRESFHNHQRRKSGVDAAAKRWFGLYSPEDQSSTERFARDECRGEELHCANLLCDETVDASCPITHRLALFGAGGVALTDV